MKKKIRRLLSTVMGIGLAGFAGWLWYTALIKDSPSPYWVHWRFYEAHFEDLLLLGMSGLAFYGAALHLEQDNRRTVWGWAVVFAIFGAVLALLRLNGSTPNPDPYYP